MDEPECPLCLEPMGIDDINFYPCSCRYQICRFCWHRIRTDEGGRCPHCRTTYSENPAEYTPPSAEQIMKLKGKGKKKNSDKKQRIIESRKCLSELRVVQKNLVFVLGLSPRLADPEILKKQEYFGKYGKIYKVVINHHTVYNGTLGPSVSAYVTYQKEEDALRAIKAVNNAYIDGRFLKASFGTTKYCSYFLRGLQCTKPDCMYLHELGDDEASFTKEDMQQGKHQDYEVATLESSCLSAGKDSGNGSTASKRSTGGGKGRQGGHSVHGNNKTSPVSKAAESALSSSSNWGSKNERGSTHGPRSKLQKQHSIPRHSEPRPLQRAHSHPTRCHGNREGERCGAYSLSSSPESITSSSESGQGGVVSTKEHSESIHYNEARSQSADIASQSSEEEEEELVTEQDYVHDAVRTLSDSPLLAEGNKEQNTCNDSHKSKGKDAGHRWFESEEKSEQNTEHWDDESNEENELTVDVFKNLGVASSGGELGLLGVSWKGQPLSSEAVKKVSSPIFMSLPWEVPEQDGNTLANLLANTTKQSPPHSDSPVDERQRLASASYVNYGPTTNNQMEQLQVREEGEGTDPKGRESLHSTLESGFKSLFMPSAIQSLSLESAIHASSIDNSAGSSSKLFNLFQNSSNHCSPLPSSSSSSNLTRNVLGSGEHDIGMEWPDMTKKREETTVASSQMVSPPPGFGSQKPQASSYTLWGEERDAMKGFFHQKGVGDSTVPTASSGHIPIPAIGQKPMSTTTTTPIPVPVPAVGQRPVPAGAIPHNVLESSLFNSHQHHSLLNRTNSNSLQQQQMAAAMKQHQQRTLAQIQQQRYQKQQQAQLTALQQQMLLQYQQQQLLAQKSQKAHKPPLSGKDFQLYFSAGWYPTYAWGIPAPMAVNSAGSLAVAAHTSNMPGRLGPSNPAHTATIGGPPGRMAAPVSSHVPSPQTVPAQPLEQKFQNVTGFK